MDENCKIYNLESFTNEERERVETLINQIKEEKKNKKKWWILPKYSIFEHYMTPIKLNSSIEERKLLYSIEEQKDSYSKSRPPLKSDFNSKEEAEEWLNNYLEEECLFNSAKDDVDNLICNFGHIEEKLRNHGYITRSDWDNCFRLFNNSMENGALFKATFKETEENG